MTAQITKQVGDYRLWGHPVWRWVEVLPEPLAGRLQDRARWWAYWFVRFGSAEGWKLLSADDRNLADEIYRWHMKQRTTLRDPFALDQDTEK